MINKTAQERREGARWYILVTLDNARPVGTTERIILDTILAIYPDFTPLELRKELDYLEDRKLIEITNKSGSTWHAELTRYGVDIVDYSVDVKPGIARPPNYGNR